MQEIIRLSGNIHIDRRNKDLLKILRETYGSTTQILVSNEELCELAAVCAKFPRYTDPEKARQELHSAAIDEVADVMIILDHIINIFGLEEKEVHDRIEGKMGRIVRWLSKSTNQEQTTVDREVKSSGGMPPAPCGRCKHFGNFKNMAPGGPCFLCVKDPYHKFELIGEVSADGNDS